MTKFTKEWIEKWKSLHIPFKSSDDYIPPKDYMEVLDEIQRLQACIEELEEQQRNTLTLSSNYSASLDNMPEPEYKRLILGSWNEVSHEEK